MLSEAVVRAVQRRNHIEQQKQLVEAKRKEVRAHKGAAAAADSLTCAHLDDVLKARTPPSPLGYALALHA